MLVEGTVRCRILFWPLVLEDSDGFFVSFLQRRAVNTCKPQMKRIEKRDALEGADAPTRKTCSMSLLGSSC